MLITSNANIKQTSFLFNRAGEYLINLCNISLEYCNENMALFIDYFSLIDQILEAHEFLKKSKYL